MLSVKESAVCCFSLQSNLLESKTGLVVFFLQRVINCDVLTEIHADSSKICTSILLWFLSHFYIKHIFHTSPRQFTLQLHFLGSRSKVVVRWTAGQQTGQTINPAPGASFIPNFNSLTQPYTVQNCDLKLNYFIYKYI